MVARLGLISDTHMPERCAALPASLFDVLQGVDLLLHTGDVGELWVDDRPANNTYERRSMEALGINFTISTGTEDAFEKLGVDRYDLAISDMARPPDDRAGYTLLEAMRQRGIDIPVMFYAGSGSPEHRAEARRRGAISSTNSPQELFQLVTSTLLGR